MSPEDQHGDDGDPKDEYVNDGGDGGPVDQHVDDGGGGDDGGPDDQHVHVDCDIQWLFLWRHHFMMMVVNTVSAPAPILRITIDGLGAEILRPETSPIHSTTTSAAMHHSTGLELQRRFSMTDTPPIPWCPQ